MVARQFSNTKSALEMAKVGGANKKWQEMMATLWPPPKNNTQVTMYGGKTIVNIIEDNENGRDWWQQKENHSNGRDWWR